MKNKPDHKPLPLELMPEISGVVSNTECTGLMPTLPKDESEFGAEQGLFSTAVPRQGRTSGKPSPSKISRH